RDVLAGVSGKMAPAWRSRHDPEGCQAVLRVLGGIFPEDQRSVGATKAKAVTHHQRNLGILDLANDGIALRSLIQILDIRRWCDKAILLHQQTVNRLMHTCRTQ